MPSTSLFAPLHLVCAPPGTGKSTVLPQLVRLAGGEAVVDIDEILTDGSLLGVRIASPSAAAVWPAYDRLWLQFAQIVRRAGHPVIMLVQVPDNDGFVAPDPAATWLGWLVPDAARRQRLRLRGWDDVAIAGADTDALRLRRRLPAEAIVTTGAADDPARVAATILARCRSRAEP